MKLSMWSSFYRELSPYDMILEFEKAGYHYTELSTEHADMLLEEGDAIAVGKKFGEFARAHNVEVSQGHLLLGVKICDEDSFDILKTWLDLFLAIGIKNAVLHCQNLHERGLTQEDIKEKNKKALIRLTDYIKGKPITICLENLRSGIAMQNETEERYEYHQSAEEFLWYINEIGSDNLGICLDTGHLNISKASTQREFILKAGKHLKALHIADNIGEGDLHMMPFCRGSVNIVEVVEALNEIGYDGLYNMELGGERKCSPKVKEYKMEYLKKCFGTLGEVV